MLFGLYPRLPTDLLSETDNSDNISRCKYVENWSKSMKEAHRIAQELNVSPINTISIITIRKFILPRRDSFGMKLHSKRGPGRLRSYRENAVNIVIGNKGGNPVYEVVSEGTKRKPRVLQRNLLLPCPYLPLDTPAQAPPPKSAKNAPQRSPTPYLTLSIC